MESRAQEVDWTALIAAARLPLGQPLAAVTFHRVFGTASRPVLMTCDNGAEFVIKGMTHDRTLVTEQIVGRLGRVIGAPVATVELVFVSPELVKAEPQLAHVTPGLVHGSKWIADCTDRSGVEVKYANMSENRNRFALLSVLYSWVSAQDQQFIYEKAAPHLVWSVDHGHFFPGGPRWSVQSLTGVPPAVVDGTFAACALTPIEIAEAVEALRSVADHDIAAAVAAIPADWVFTAAEREAVARYLARRRSELLAFL